MNPKNPTSREKQEHEDSGHAVHRSWCAACVEGRVVGQHRIELLEEEEEGEKTTPIVPLTQTRSQFRFAETGQTGATCCERKRPTAYSISFLVGFMIPQGPPEGDHMANSRVEMAVREVKRQCRTLRFSAEQNTSVRISDDTPLLSRLPRFAAQVMNKMRLGQRWKIEGTEENWSKTEKLDKKFGFVKLEKTVSALLQIA